MSKGMWRMIRSVGSFPEKEMLGVRGNVGRAGVSDLEKRFPPLAVGLAEIIVEGVDVLESGNFAGGTWGATKFVLPAQACGADDGGESVGPLFD